MKLSAIIIAKNAEHLIADCIDSIQFCDEILIIDGGSTDRTSDVAKRMGARIIKGVERDFAEQRNIGLSASKGEWIFYIDTDERVSTELQNTIIATTRKELQEVYVYKILRQNFYLGDHPWPKIEKLERLFKREALINWKGKVHESPVTKGRIGELDGYLLHYTHRDLSSMLAKTVEWSEIEAKLRYDAKHPRMTWWRFLRVMATAFFDSYILQEGWKVGTVGLIESIYQSFSMFITYARLWEMQQEHSLQ
ncbi:MAG TPA: glycosyltransferase family 2 protein [Patescibacteria group bacterium]|nr:glycosyltransferase family 2 protein [Patescibacteria group bacterium]